MMGAFPRMSLEWQALPLIIENELGRSVRKIFDNICLINYSIFECSVLWGPICPCAPIHSPDVIDNSWKQLCKVLGLHFENVEGCSFQCMSITVSLPRDPCWSERLARSEWHFGGNSVIQHFKSGISSVHFVRWSTCCQATKCLSWRQSLQITTDQGLGLRRQWWPQLWDLWLWATPRSQPLWSFISMLRAWQHTHFFWQSSWILGWLDASQSASHSSPGRINLLIHLTKNSRMRVWGCTSGNLYLLFYYYMESRSWIVLR